MKLGVLPFDVMIKVVLTWILVLNAGCAFADWPLIHFLKCRIITADTTVVGYFTAPFEGMPDSVLTKLKNDRRYFESKVLNRLTTIELNSFTYVHYYINEKDSSRNHAIYKSADRLIIDVKSIRKIDLLEVKNFQFVPNVVVTDVVMSDTLWMAKPVLKMYQDNDQCYPYRFLVYDDTIDYESIIAKVMIESDKRESIVKGLGRHKILGLRLNCCD